MVRRIAVRAIVVRDGKLLCVRLKQYTGALSIATETEWWCLPGCGLEVSEPLQKGIERELIEETGIGPTIGNVLFIQQFATPDSDTEHLEFFFHVTNADDYTHIDLAKTSHGDAEIAEIAFVDPRTTNILPDFLRTEDIAARISDGTPKIVDRLPA